MCIDIYILYKAFLDGFYFLSTFKDDSAFLPFPVLLFLNLDSDSIALKTYHFELAFLVIFLTI